MPRPRYRGLVPRSGADITIFWNSGLILSNASKNLSSPNAVWGKTYLPICSLGGGKLGDRQCSVGLIIVGMWPLIWDFEGVGKFSLWGAHSKGNLQILNPRSPTRILQMLCKTQHVNVSIFQDSNHVFQMSANMYLVGIGGCSLEDYKGRKWMLSWGWGNNSPGRSNGNFRSPWTGVWHLIWVVS